MDKLDPRTAGRSRDLTADNIAELRALFPEVFTEGRIDFDALRQVLGDHVEERAERYGLNWTGKAAARQLAQQPSAGTLRPARDESVNWDTTQNLFIEGDNLEVLKLLQKSYHRKVKMIYIDPPYNTGNEFIYPDRFQDNLDTYLRYTGQVDGEGLKLTANAETSGRYHTNWLNMMYPRLKLARNLLRDDGVIFVSIDDNEIHNLRHMLDDLMGSENFVAQLPWQARQSVQNDTDISVSHEYILAYARSRRQTQRRLKETNIDSWHSEPTFAVLPKPSDPSRYDNPDRDYRGPWKADPFDAPNVRPNLTYPIVNPTTGVTHWPPAGRCWRTEEDNFRRLLADGRIVFGRHGDARPQLKVFYEEKKQFGEVRSTWFDGDAYGTATHGTRELQELFGGAAPFDFPKPTRLLSELLQMATRPGDIVLDFFAGSGSTGDAVLRYAAGEDARRFILVQLPEPEEQHGFGAISAITRERLCRVTSAVGGGFRSFRLASTNIKLWDGSLDNVKARLLDAIDNIKPGRSDEDVLFELLLKYGLDLASPIETRTIERTKVFVIGAGALVVCLAKGIDLRVVEGIVALKGELQPEIMRVVFQDASFADDVVKTNAVQLLRRAGIDDVKSL